LPLPDHDAILSGDTPTTLTLNYQWRRIIVDAIDRHLEFAFENAVDPDKIDAIMKFRALLDDLYIDP